MKRSNLKASTDIGERGFSLVELIISMVLTLVILGVAVATFSGALGTRDRETSKTDALNSAQAAINIMSREIGNSGYGLTTNGIVLADSNDKRIHFRANTGNSDLVTTGPGEDVTFYYDAESQSVVRYDPNVTPTTSGIINRVSDVDFVYWNYAFGLAPQQSLTPAENTARVQIKLTVILADVRGQPIGQTVQVQSDVTLRNSPFMRGQY
jgi:prepilin-type N-terminal cleavage/methylation domain-containing protein